MDQGRQQKKLTKQERKNYPNHALPFEGNNIYISFKE
jgi:hypothetical protein